MNMSFEELKKKIFERKVKVGIIGFGYVGMPLGVEFAENGIKVTAFEKDESKIKSVNKGSSYVIDIKNDKLAPLVKKGNIKATGDFSELKKNDAVIICVPTPLRKSKDPDVSYIVSSCKVLSENLKKGMLVILESTTYPGTTSELVKPILEKSGLKAGKDFWLAFSPERVDPGNIKYGIRNTPKIVGGFEEKSSQLAAELYSIAAEKVVKVSSCEAAEMVKLLENTFRAVNIAMINEMALMCERLGLNIWEIIEAAKTKPFGFMPFYPGPGIGGHCIPLDPHYLGWKMKTLNFEPRFIELAGAVNSAMPEYVIMRLYKLLSENKKPLKGSKILVLGAAYKADISDERESPAIDIIALLARHKAKVFYHDPYIKEITVSGIKYKDAGFKNLSFYDCVVIITGHSCLNYAKLVKESKLIFDARNVLKNFKSDKIIRL
ncbi:MAG: nucleotide sugar dehydrogenase [Elusimicrobiota bacterium]